MVKTIIFDFDGTLADTISLGIRIVNDYADIYKYKKLDRENNGHLSAKEIVKAIEVNPLKLPYLMFLLRKKLGQQSDQIQIFPGIIEILNDLKKEGYQMGIITSNSQKNVSDFLKRNNIESYFSYIKTKVSMFGKKDALIKAKKILKTNFLYVGDEIRDVEACKKSNTPIVCVGWGLNSADGLESHNPGLVANTAEEALVLIKKIAESL
ncbi:MAG: HAD-IA family hydrolase [Treponema sp.]|nr:HAD-IA family hydrolase [Treponema sp.]